MKRLREYNISSNKDPLRGGADGHARTAGPKHSKWGHESMVIAPVLATLADRRARGIASTAGSSAHHVLFVWYFLRLG